MAVYVSGQDLAGAAKREKARRGKLKATAAETTTNSDLAKVKKKASVEQPAPVQTEGQAPPPGEEGNPRSGQQTDGRSGRNRERRAGFRRKKPMRKSGGPTSRTNTTGPRSAWNFSL
ncbi:MAG: hypothetical protein MZV63_25845 [Marinilabiliales bacterium]|nr:hypothetical protein [Marinilabiliales bacterium]